MSFSLQFLLSLIHSAFQSDRSLFILFISFCTIFSVTVSLFSLISSFMISVSCPSTFIFLVVLPTLLFVFCFQMCFIVLIIFIIYFFLLLKCFSFLIFDLMFFYLNFTFTFFAACFIFLFIFQISVRFLMFDRICSAIFLTFMLLIFMPTLLFFYLCLSGVAFFNIY